MFDISPLWSPRFSVSSSDRIVTFGSCFAQHFGKALEPRGFDWCVTESAPRGLSPENARKYNYSVFSCRTGNIYTTTLLRQWVDWAIGDVPVPDEVWLSNGRFSDPFRPNIEPDGFLSEAELVASRDHTIDCLKDALTSADVFVFTLGLTESWVNSHHAFEYPMCPGTVAGSYSAEQHRFVNLGFLDVLDSLTETMQKIRSVNGRVKFLLTVSPVPLTATMSGNHVLVATMQSKSTLRAVAGELAARHEFVDYFPSYEIINSPPFKGIFFESNQRTVSKAGVSHVMDCFFGSLTGSVERVSETVDTSPSDKEDDEVCEEVLLDAFKS